MVMSTEIYFIGYLLKIEDIRFWIATHYVFHLSYLEVKRQFQHLNFHGLLCCSDLRESDYVHMTSQSTIFTR